MSKGSAPTTLLEGYQEKLHKDSGFNPDLWDDFTFREQQVVRGLIVGRSVKETAGDLDISPNTAKVHLRHAFRKANVHGAVALLLRLYRLEIPKITATPNIAHVSRLTKEAA